MSDIPSNVKFVPIEDALNEQDGSGEYILYPSDINESPNPYDSKTEFHVNFLKNKFADLARSNQFKVFIHPPKELKVDWDSSKNGLLVLVKAAKIPSITTKEFVFQRAGQKLYIPTGEVEHGDVSITFYNDSNFILRTMFTRWVRLALHNWEYNIGSIPLVALGGEVVIYHYDYELKPIYEVRLTNAWPKQISEIDLSQESSSTVEEFTVDFNYTYQKMYRYNKES
jgi:hypothetical protein